jgi:aromatic ring-opening dioxygenase catalytic subunit (LigB family)
VNLLQQVYFPELRVWRQNNIKTRTLKQGRGLDHGVFVPFKLMFPTPCPIPIIEVSMDATLDPQRLLELGKALIPLRYLHSLISLLIFVEMKVF